MKHLQRNMAMLGFAKAFPNSAGFLEDERLFEHSNPKAFQEFVYFLLVHNLLDKSAAAAFRNCWPVLDRKLEADFRKVAFEHYEKIQSSSGNYLPHVNRSLLMTPGGKKIIAFLFELSRFAVLRRVQSFYDKTTADKTSAEALWSRRRLVLEAPQLSGGDDLDAVTPFVYRAVAAENMKTIEEVSQEQTRVVEEAKIFIEETAQQIRKMKEELASLDERYDSLGAGTRHQMRQQLETPAEEESHAEEDEDFLSVFRSECHRRRDVRNGLAAELAPHAIRITKSLRLIRDTLPRENEDTTTPTVDVTSVARSDGSEHFSSVLNRLMEGSDYMWRYPQGDDFPKLDFGPAVASLSSLVAAATDRQRTMEKDLPQVQQTNGQLRQKVHALQMCDKESRTSFPRSYLVPLAIDFALEMPSKISSPWSLLPCSSIETVGFNSQKKPLVPNCRNNVVADVKTPSASTDVFMPSFSISSRSFHTDDRKFSFVSAEENGNDTIVASAKGHPRIPTATSSYRSFSNRPNVTGTSAHVDISKLSSVFSPVLSSSRMDASFVSPNLTDNSVTFTIRQDKDVTTALESSSILKGEDEDLEDKIGCRIDRLMHTLLLEDEGKGGLLDDSVELVDM